MNGDKTRIGILGGGPAGLAAALGLAQRGFAPVLVERAGGVGGNAGSFDLAGMKVDYGSHRLHPNTDPEILSFLQSILGSDLLERPRHGRIFLKGRWVHFPLRPLNLALRAHPTVIIGVLTDLARSYQPWTTNRSLPKPDHESFATLLQRGLGRTICDEFYFPFARKIWGLDPEEISPSQARKRVSARSISSILARLLPGGTGPGGQRSGGTYFYPRAGFGQISDRIWEAALAAGASPRLKATLKRVLIRPDSFEAEVEQDGAVQTLVFDQLWSTIPVGSLVRMIEPSPPAEVLQSAGNLRQRAMVLVYLVLDQNRFTEFDAHYVPAPEVPFTRLSEPKNYSAGEGPKNRTVLCAEIPCSRGDPLWTLPERDLAGMVEEGLRTLGLPIQRPILDVAVRRLPAAYPIFQRGYEAHLDAIESWVEAQPGLVSFGRQGLFTHDNTHHALFTARSAVECLGDDGSFDTVRWNENRKVFATHVVED